MNDEAVLQKLSELGIELPPMPKAVAAYLPFRRADHLVFLAGQVPLVEGQVLHPGRLGEDVSVAQGVEAARRAGVQLLAALRGGLGSFELVRQVVQLSVFVAATPAFREHPTVANGASELFAEVLGEPGEHARAAVGVASLPLGASVEVAATVLVA